MRTDMQAFQFSLCVSLFQLSLYFFRMADDRDWASGERQSFVFIFALNGRG